MIYDILIIGGGCAGISAALYAASRGRKTLLVEQELQIGGEIRRISTVTHFAGAFDGESGPSLAQRMEDQLKQYEVSLVRGAVLSASLESTEKVITASSGEYRARSVIIAAGTTQKNLEGMGEPLFSRVMSHCAHRDAAQYAGKHVFVIGGSDGAAKEALYLSAVAKKVTMVMPEPKLAAIPQFSKRIAASETIQVMVDSSLKQIYGTDRLQSVEIINNIAKDSVRLEADGGGIFVYIGSTPNTGWCQGLRLENGYIVTDDAMRTNLPNVYAAGDIRAKAVRQISTAVSDGTIAAIHASASLQ